MGRVLQNAVDAFQYSQFVQWFYSTRNGFDDLGPGWNAAAVIFGAVVVGHQGWWWHTVIRRHWKLPQPTLTWALLGIIAWSLAILAAIGPMSYRYIFANT